MNNKNVVQRSSFQIYRIQEYRALMFESPKEENRTFFFFFSRHLLFLDELFL